MVIVEASHISYGGGYTLLVYLLEELSKRSIYSKVYIANKNIYEDLKKNNFYFTTIIFTSTLNTLLRYTTKREKVIYFLNLPPFVNNKKSFVYFHNELIVNSEKFKFKYLIYFYWLKHFSANVDAIVCQTENILNALKNNKIKNVLKLPFFQDYFLKIKLKKKYTFCYVCNGEPHKNLNRLFEAIQLLAKKYEISLALTIEDCYRNKILIERIDSINDNLGKKVIFNHGLISNEYIQKMYNESKAMVFPSLKESMGLPLIEANMCGIKVLSSDLPFSHELLNSPIVFDPYNSSDIARTLELFINGKFDKIKQTIKIKNKIGELINIIK